MEEPRVGSHVAGARRREAVGGACAAPGNPGPARWYPGILSAAFPPGRRWSGFPLPFVVLLRRVSHGCCLFLPPSSYHAAWTSEEEEREEVGKAALWPLILREGPAGRRGRSGCVQDRGGPHRAGEAAAAGAGVIEADQCRGAVQRHGGLPGADSARARCVPEATVPAFPVLSQLSREGGGARGDGLHHSRLCRWWVSSPLRNQFLNQS